MYFWCGEILWLCYTVIFTFRENDYRNCKAPFPLVALNTTILKLYDILTLNMKRQSAEDSTTDCCRMVHKENLYSVKHFLKNINVSQSPVYLHFSRKFQIWSGPDFVSELRYSSASLNFASENSFSQLVFDTQYIITAIHISSSRLVETLLLLFDTWLSSI